MTLERLETLLAQADQTLRVRVALLGEPPSNDNCLMLGELQWLLVTAIATKRKPAKRKVSR